MEIISPKYDFTFKELLNNEIVRKLKGADRLDDWVRFFNAESREDLDMINTKNVGIIEAIKEIKVMSLSKRLRLRYEARMKEMRDKAAREEYVRDEGIELGRRELLTEKICKKLVKGKTIEQIAEDLDEDVEVIQVLAKKIGKE